MLRVGDKLLQAQPLQTTFQGMARNAKDFCCAAFMTVGLIKRILDQMTLGIVHAVLQLRITIRNYGMQIIRVIIRDVEFSRQ